MFHICFLDLELRCYRVYEQFSQLVSLSVPACNRYFIRMRNSWGEAECSLKKYLEHFRLKKFLNVHTHIHTYIRLAGFSKRCSLKLCKKTSLCHKKP